MKKLTLLIALAFIIQATAVSQSCLPEGITFTTQLQIDNFKTNYPNCTEIEGDVQINGDDIINLNGLNVLTSFGGGLWIQDNFALTTLTGLDNLYSIGENLWVIHNYALTSLIGLENVTSSGGDLRIDYNGTLTSLTGLENLSSIGRSLSITNNDALSSLDGLNNIDVASISNLYITGNKLLANCEAESICQYLSSPYGPVNIFNNAPGCNSPSEIANACGFTITCLPYGNYYFFNQAEIDSFQSYYPDCTELEGRIEINGDEILNLAGLNNITSIGGGLGIQRNALMNLTGLENMTSIGGSLGIYYTNALTNLTGLENVTSIGGGLYISSNNSLTSLTGLEHVTSIEENMFFNNNDALMNLIGLENVTYIGGYLHIASNNALTSLTGLKNVTSIAGYLKIKYNNSLTSLTGLDNLNSIGGNVDIRGNTGLTNLTGLENVNASSICNLYIFENSSLATCEVQSVCDYLTAPSGNIFIHDNAPGCNSPEEVQDSCWVAIEEIMVLSEIAIHPNPFTTSTTITYGLQQPASVQITIYNHLGKQLEVIHQKQSAGKQQVVWNAEGLPSGVYYCVLKTREGTQTMKMIKMK